MKYRCAFCGRQHINKSQIRVRCVHCDNGQIFEIHEYACWYTMQGKKVKVLGKDGKMKWYKYPKEEE